MARRTHTYAIRLAVGASGRSIDANIRALASIVQRHFQAPEGAPDPASANFPASAGGLRSLPV